MISTELYSTVCKYAENGLQIRRIELPAKLFAAYIEEQDTDILKDMDIRVVETDTTEPAFFYEPELK